MFSSTGGIVLLVVTVVVLLARRRLDQALAVTTLVLGSWWSSLILKHVIDRPRPGGIVTWSQSYPSGHVVLVTAVVMSTFLLLHERSADVRDLVVVVLGALLITAVAVSRVIAGAHYLTDTIGAVLWSSGMVVLLSGLRQPAERAVRNLRARVALARRTRHRNRSAGR